MRTIMPCAAAVVSLLAAPSFAQAEGADSRTPEAIALQSALERVCVPLIAGQDPDAVSQASGLRQRDGQWVLTVDGRKELLVLPPTPANPNVCSLTVTYDAGGEKPILDLLNAWALANSLEVRRVREPSEGPLRDRRTSSWEGSRQGAPTALVFSEEKTKDGKPVAGDLDQATVLLSIARAA
ncbi:hypothetical protein [Phenylobacterium sp.]|uniref:hypothetical protein n=1 Tax=Phenylobacterium sp. TaxID=1871053 RepID=UPI0035B19C05